MRMALDHLGRHGRWLGWGPVRHGVGGNIAAYVRIVEEACFVELYCDMEQLQAGHSRAPLARRPLLVQHVGPAAAALLLPLRCRGDRVGAREPGDARRPACHRVRRAHDGAHDPAGLHRSPARPAGRAEPGAAAAVALRRPTSWSSTSAPIPRPRPRCCPTGLEPHPDPGRCAAVFADWQSCSDTGEELIDPVRAQYREFYLVVNALLDGEEVTTCAFIWVDQDFALARGWIQGFPKKLGEVWMTRTYPLACAAAPGSPPAARGSARPARRAGAQIARATVTLEDAERERLGAHRPADRQRPPLPASGRGAPRRPAGPRAGALAQPRPRRCRRSGRARRRWSCPPRPARSTRCWRRSTSCAVTASRFAYTVDDLETVRELGR